MFLPCVLVPGAHETRGGARFFNIFLPNTGGRASSAKCFCETRGANGRQICCPLFFCSGEVFGLFPVAAAGQARKKKKQKKKKKKKQKTKGEKNDKKKTRNKKKREEEEEEEEEEEAEQQQK